MPMYDVSIRTFVKNESQVTNLQVICRTPIGAGVSALMALNIQNPRFTLTVKPMMEVRNENG